jgi:hypothetical protein
MANRDDVDLSDVVHTAIFVCDHMSLTGAGVTGEVSGARSLLTKVCDCPPPTGCRTMPDSFDASLPHCRLQDSTYSLSQQENQVVPDEKYALLKEANPREWAESFKVAVAMKRAPDFLRASLSMPPHVFASVTAHQK